MSQVGDIITVRGKPEKVVERELILRDDRPFYYAVRTVPVDEFGHEIEPVVLQVKVSVSTHNVPDLNPAVPA